MLILLTKKINTFYKCKPEDIPLAVYSPDGMARQLYKQFFLYAEDYLNNLNIQSEIVNIKHVKKFSIFDYDDDQRGLKGNEWLLGANTKVIFNDNSVIYVTETINEIVSKTGAI